MAESKTSPSFLHMFPLGANDAEWLHLCIRHEGTSGFLMDDAMLDDLIVQAMVEEDTRSRIRVQPDGIMVLLKAMHVRDAGMAKPEDMISMRIWIDAHRAITTREEDIDPIRDIAGRFEAGTGPATPGAFLADLIALHMNEVVPFIERLEDAVTGLDLLIAQRDVEMACNRLADLQLQVSGFLRHLGPQRQVLETLVNLDHPSISDRDRSRFDDVLNTLLRTLETLQSLRERSDILNDQVTRIQDRQLGQNSYIFAVAAAVFLPLGFLTGLFGVNLGGIPMATDPLGFWLLLIGCVGLGFLLIGLVRWKKWF
jgi:zinc transporter